MTLFDTNLVFVSSPVIALLCGQAIALVKEQSWLFCLTFLARFAARTAAGSKQNTSTSTPIMA